MITTFHSRVSFIEKINTDSFLKFNPDVVAISVITDESEKFDLNSSWLDAIQLEFEDTIDINNPKCFNQKQAEQLYNFIIKYKNKSGIIVHCTMGVSRSAAISLFIEEYILGKEIELHRSKYCNYNRYVYGLLLKEYIKHEYRK